MGANKVDFLVVGAQKAGTTTLHEWLKTSPEIVLPRQKETQFFLDAKQFSKGAEWYFDQFTKVRPTTKLFGEVDPDYLYFPETDARIAQFAKVSKFIIVLRDPLARARSHYQMSVSLGREPLAFADALRAESSRLAGQNRFSLFNHSYLDRGLYTRQIERMKQAFPDSSFLILLFDDLFSSQAGANDGIRKLCEFLEVDSSSISIDVGEKRNEASAPRFVGLRNFMHGNSNIKKICGKLIPTPHLRRRAKSAIIKLNAKAISDGGGSSFEGVRQDVPTFFYRAVVDDLIRLEKLLELDLSRWLDAYRSELQVRGVQP